VRFKLLMSLASSLALLLYFGESRGQSAAQTRTPGNIALINGQWFNGTGFERRTMYSVDGRFATKKPSRIDRTLDLGGAWIVPPFGEAHNHNIMGTLQERNLATLKRYLADGVFYVKIQGNYPLSDEMRKSLPMNRPEGPDVALAQTFITAPGGHPIYLHETRLMPAGLYPGLKKEDLRDKLYFTIDSPTDIERKWSEVMKLRPDFIKINLWYSDEYEKRRRDDRYVGRRALDPALVPAIVARAHAASLRVSAHTVNAADVRVALGAGVDEIVHMPSLLGLPSVEARAFELFDGAVDSDTLRKLIDEAGKELQARHGSLSLVTKEDARDMAKRGTVVITTFIAAPEKVAPLVSPFALATLRVLRDHDVTIAIGSDTPMDTSRREFERVRALAFFSNLELLTMWAVTTPRIIFPGRMIGELKDGYEASFLALEGNPLENLDHVQKIRMRFKQGLLLDE
jgi:hypothetical protein